MAENPTARRRGRPPSTTRQAIVDRARLILDADGLDGLTMRRLARELGVSPMGLYGHVADKDELLVLVLDAEVADVTAPPPHADPRTRVMEQLVFIRGILDAHPWVLEVITPGDRFAPRIIPVVDVLASGLIDCGLGAEAAAHAYRTLWHALLGELTVRHAAARRAADPTAPPPMRTLDVVATDPGAMRTLAAIGDAWAESLPAARPGRGARSGPRRAARRGAARRDRRPVRRVGPTRPRQRAASPAPPGPAGGAPGRWAGRASGGCS